jgi:hypothetical protein
MQRRAILSDLLRQVMDTLEQIVPEQGGLVAYQSRFVFPDGAEYLLRAIVAERQPRLVVTVYRTSRVAKYWRSA